MGRPAGVEQEGQTDCGETKQRFQGHYRSLGLETAAEDVRKIAISRCEAARQDWDADGTNEMMPGHDGDRGVVTTCCPCYPCCPCCPCSSLLLCVCRGCRWGLKLLWPRQSPILRCRGHHQTQGPMSGGG